MGMNMVGAFGGSAENRPRLFKTARIPRGRRYLMQILTNFKLTVFVGFGLIFKNSYLILDIFFGFVLA